MKWLLILLSSVPLYSLEISEDILLKEFLSQTPPGLKQQMVNTSQSRLGQAQLSEKYAGRIHLQGKHERTKEKPIINFVPIFSPVTQAIAEYQKITRHGFALGAGFSFDQRTADPSINRAVTTSPYISATVDLWKNFAGRIDQIQKKKSDLLLSHSQTLEKISKKNYFTRVQKLYWSWVATDLSKSITTQLLKRSQNQLRIIKNKARDAIADRGDVALFESQVIRRRAQITDYNYQLNIVKNAIKELLPSLQLKELSLTPYDSKSMVSKVLSCSEQIKKFETIPLEYTNLDEVIASLKEINQNSIEEAKRYSDIDVKFMGRYQLKGVNSPQGGGNFSDSIDDFTSNNRQGFSVGLQVSIPLGSSAKDTQKIINKKNQLMLEAESEQLKVKLSTTHRQLKDQIFLLQSLAKDSELNTKKLGQRISILEKKYQQARISIDDLINDQNNYLTSELNTVSVKLKLLNTILDYFSVFPDFPCSINKSKGFQS